MKACSVELINIAKEVLNLESGSFTTQQVTSPTTTVNSTILIKINLVFPMLHTMN